MNRAVFLDRDGVVIVDADLITQIDQIHVIDGIPEALRRLKKAGFLLIIVSNQPVVARGLITETEVIALNDEIQHRIIQSGGCGFNGFYFCPHHPNATLQEFRIVCECRKPAPGLLFQAATDKAIDLKTSFMVGDRITDIIAGKNAGCTTIQVLSGMHEAAPIVTTGPIDLSIKADHICSNLLQAANWILEKQ
jgi:D-glycero-D-manno-heptose 1,7-bisphosphate phosphatase